MSFFKAAGSVNNLCKRINEDILTSVDISTMKYEYGCEDIKITIGKNGDTINAIRLGKKIFNYNWCPNGNFDEDFLHQFKAKYKIPELKLDIRDNFGGIVGVYTYRNSTKGWSVTISPYYIHLNEIQKSSDARFE